MQLLNRDQILARLNAGRGPIAEIRNANGDQAEVLIFDEVGIFGVDQQQFAEQLATITAPEILVRISSPGGSVFDGIGMYNALRAHSSRIVVRVESMAASIASVIVQAGDRREIMTGGQMMIHEAFGIEIGTAEDFRKTADILDKQSSIIAAIYAERGNKTKSAYQSMMEAETWFDATEAVKAGLADEVVKPSRQEKKAMRRSGADQILDEAQWRIWAADAEAALQAATLDGLHERFLDLTIGEPVGYRIVPQPPTKFAAEARSILASEAVNLGVKAPPLRFIDKAAPGIPADFQSRPIRGCWRDGAIHVRITEPSHTLRGLLRHELSHALGGSEDEAQTYEKGSK